MKIKARQKGSFGRRGRLLLCLTLGLTLFAANSAFPPTLSATSSRSTVTQSVMQEVLPGLVMKQAKAPVSLQDFTKQTIRQLSADAPFQAWKDAGTEVFPLGPGTHGWLVNVMNGEQRIGYLIISAAEQGGYLLSEYGAGTYGLPYSMSDLRQYLVQEGLLTSQFSGKIGLSALYAPLLPVWKLTLENKTLYLNASVLQVLPWSFSQEDNLLNGRLDPKAVVLAGDGTGQQAHTPAAAQLSGGQDDPYADLLWLTAPKLTTVSAASLTVLLAGRGSLAFQSPGHNDALGAPFMVTGCQSWLPEDGSQQSSAAAVVYAATGRGGQRYLPLAALKQYGSFHKPPQPLADGAY